MLFVDDQDEVLNISVIFLAKNGLEVTPANSARRALELLHDHRYDAIISDYMMPGMDGLELLKILRRRGDSTPFIILTARENEGVVLESLDNGADFYLQKNRDPELQYATLGHMVNRAIERRRIIQNLFSSERSFRETAEGSKLIAILLDPSGKALFCTDSFLQLTGWRREEVLGKDWITSFNPKGTQDRVRNEVLGNLGLDRKGILGRYVGEIITRSGDAKVISWDYTPIRDEQGKVLCIACVGKDETTMRLRFENEIQMRFESGEIEEA